MNLAEATSALSKKESEKTVVLEEIEKLRDLRDEGAVAILHATVFGIAPTTEDADVKFSYQLFEEDQTEVASVSVDQSINDSIRFNLPSKNGKLVITVVTGTKIADELDPEAEPTLKVLKYKSEFGVSEIPEDGELRTDISAERVLEEGETVEDATPVTLKFKASVDDIAALLGSKELELRQLEEEFRAIVSAVQEAKKRQAAPKAKKETSVKKTKKSARTSSGEVATGSSARSTSAAEDTPQGPSYLDQAVSGVMVGGAYLMQNYAYIAFGVAAVGIHLYGDYASV